MTSEQFQDAAEWLKGKGPSSDVVLSSRVRLARNIAGFAFPGRASLEDRRRVIELAQEHICGSTVDEHLVWIDISEVERTERMVLVERHLISKQHAGAKGPRGVAITSPHERLSVMVNEEDHLRVQVLRSGLALGDALEQIDTVDDALEARLDFAYSPRFGYLTACPTNVGTGIRVSVMLHLPALKMSGELEKVRRAAKAMSLAVRGYYGEGSDAAGDFYQISNQTTLGKSEQELLEEFEQQIIPKVIEYERLARRNMLEKRRAFVEDQVFRALGMLRYARLLKTDEAMERLSLVRLGVVLGVVSDVDIRTVNQLTLFTQPAHLQKLRQRAMDQAERREERATLVREALDPHSAGGDVPRASTREG
jgi:protein arginine kinase